MSGAGTPAGELSRILGSQSASGKRIAVVAASWHPDIVEAMVDRAVAELQRMGAAQIEIYRVPGSFEIPVMVANLVEKFDGFITLGLVLRGQTAHFEYVCSGVTQGIVEISVSSKKPIAFGVLMCETLEQAIDRSGVPGSAEDKGVECAQAVIATLIAIDSTKVYL
jgi:6,7-dimethyl-8-ribityllumazine synthase